MNLKRRLFGLFLIFGLALTVVAAKAPAPKAAEFTVGSAKTAGEFFAKELPIWKDLYIGLATANWTPKDKSTYKSFYWRNSLTAYLAVCPTSPAQYPATLNALKESPLLPFIPFDSFDDTPLNGDFLTLFQFQPGSRTMTGVTDDEKNLILSKAPVGSLILFKEEIPEGDKKKTQIGYGVVLYNPYQKEPRLEVADINSLPAADEAQPLRCLANQMVFYILGYYAAYDKLPAKPEDLDKKVALLNPAVWEDKKQGPLARQVWDGLAGIKH